MNCTSVHVSSVASVIDTLHKSFISDQTAHRSTAEQPLPTFSNIENFRGVGSQEKVKRSGLIQEVCVWVGGCQGDHF